MNQTSLFASLVGLDARSILAMFWFLILFEGPRFAMAGIATAIAVIRYGRSAPGPAGSLARSPARRSVSVIIACHNGADGLRKTVASLREQALHELQIVVVDDGSVDGTSRTARALRDINAPRKSAVDLVISSDLRGGKSAALNLALNYCVHEVIVCVDCDTTFDRESLAHIVAAFDDPHVGAAGGNIGIRNPDGSLLATMQAVEYTIGISLGRRIGMMLGILPIASGAYSAFRRDALAAIGGWEAGPGEDGDLTMKLRHAGWEVVFVPEARALTDAPTRLGGLISQRLRWESDLLRLHAQKFRIVLSPRSRNFSLRNAIGALDVLVFSFGMSVVFAVYLVWLLASYGAVATLSILAVSIMVYSVFGLVYFALGTSLAATPRVLRLLPYACGYAVYSLFVLQPVRLCACVDELLFHRSMRPGFVPSKVTNQIRSV